jgi:hypothetical protein
MTLISFLASPIIVSFIVIRNNVYNPSFTLFYIFIFYKETLRNYKAMIIRREEPTGAEASISCIKFVNANNVPVHLNGYLTFKYLLNIMRENKIIYDLHATI